MTRSRHVAPTASALAGVGAAVIALLPWLVTGMPLPLRGIVGVYTAPEHAPVALLPLSHYYLVESVAMVLVGSALAGVTIRVAALRGTALNARYVSIGTVAVQAIALAQSATVIRDGLQPTSQAEMYFFALVVGVLVAIAAGVGVLVGLARGSAPATTIAATAGALALGPWIATVVLPIEGDWTHGASLSTLQLGTTLSALTPLLIVGAVAGWCGVATGRRAAATATAFIALWTVPKLVMAFGYAVSSHTHFLDPQHMWSAGSRFFIDLLLSAAAVQQLFIAAVVALLVAIVLRSLRGGGAR